jgi:hypothetical protein
MHLLMMCCSQQQQHGLDPLSWHPMLYKTPFSINTNPPFAQPNTNPVLPEEQTDTTVDSTSSEIKSLGIDNGRNGQELMKTISNKINDETESSKYSNGNACGGMSKETLTASWTSVSEELKKCLLQPPGTQSTRKRIFCRIL